MSELRHYNAPQQKLNLLERQGILLRMRRGLYVVNPEYSGKKLFLGLIANHLYGHSYVSMHTALRHYGLIPERVDTVMSVCMERGRTITTAVGVFTYCQCPVDYFSLGVKMVGEDGICWLMAGPEKALCDLVVCTSGVNLRSLASAREFLLDDMRLDHEGLAAMDTAIIEACARAGRKSESLRNVIKVIEQLKADKHDDI